MARKYQLLNDKHQLLIGNGQLHRQQLKRAIKTAIAKSSKRDFYIYSPPGLGKTYTTEQEFANHNITPVMIEGNTSLWGFTVDLAMIMMLRDPKKHIYLFIDDCDNLLLHKDSVNTLKIALAKGLLKYNKQLMAQYAMLDDEQKEAIDMHRVEGRNAVEIPLQNMTIIWCSNYRLADQQILNSIKDTSSTKYMKALDETALRRRLNAKDYDMPQPEMWGWIADCILNETPPSMKKSSLFERERILLFMYDNLDKIKELNITFAEKLYEEMVLDPVSYDTAWEYDYLV
jgi:hypothetical protein